MRRHRRIAAVVAVAAAMTFVRATSSAPPHRVPSPSACCFRICAA
jgi:hypothetical protein